MREAWIILCPRRRLIYLVSERVEKLQTWLPGTEPLMQSLLQASVDQGPQGRQISIKCRGDLAEFCHSCKAIGLVSAPLGEVTIAELWGWGGETVSPLQVIQAIRSDYSVCHLVELYVLYFYSISLFVCLRAAITQEITVD